MARQILVTTSTYPRYAGDSTPSFVAQFARQLAGRGNNVTVLAPHAKGAKTLETSDGVTVRRYRYFWPSGGETLAYDGGAVMKIKKTPAYAVKLLLFMTALTLSTVWQSPGRRTDCINAHWIIPQGFVGVLAGRLTGKKVVVSVHGSDIFGMNGKVMRTFKAFTLKHADAVVVNSSATLQACRAVYERPDYVVIPMGVDMEKFKPLPPSAELRKRYGLGRFTILFVGRLTEQKGVRYLLEAAKQLKDTGAEFKALVVGEGPEKADLEAFVRSNNLTDTVVFVGWVDVGKLPEYYSVADVFVGPSITADGKWQEALGLVFAEAQACGVPVIATNTGGIPDVVEDGSSGSLVPEQSAEAIAQKLRDFYEHPEKLKKLAANARNNIQTKFSWESVIDRYEQVFNQ